ncbi:unnamed protein product [Ambrosiozyma monospora]|uniref:Unnamed protein product n=1 Tax=Ambrosiozyma monospora TaxID=43982 RepID=A0ACB5SYF1_AMBMO|nr:unnamed protein product [Ambrosiozyma monospora]
MQSVIRYSKGLSKTTTTFSRTISSTRVLLTDDIPDNAPSLNENAQWLNNLEKDKQFSKNQQEEPLDNVPTSTYSIKTRSKLEFPETNPDFQTFRTVRSKTAYNIVRTPNPKENEADQYHTISVPASDYFLSSSPFSTLPAHRRPKADNRQPFSDLRIVRLKSGKGGNGTVSFFRDASIATGPPDGGDGGDGGNVYVTAVKGLSSLHGLRSKYIAKDGSPGQDGQLDGKKGDDVHLIVPVGTSIKWCPEPSEVRSLQQNHDNKVFHIHTVVQDLGNVVPKYIQFFRNSYHIGKGWIFKEKNEEYHLAKDYFNDLNKNVKIHDRQLKYDELINDVFPLDGIDFPKPTENPKP